MPSSRVLDLAAEDLVSKQGICVHADATCMHATNEQANEQASEQTNEPANTSESNKSPEMSPDIHA